MHELIFIEEEKAWELVDKQEMVAWLGYCLFYSYYMSGGLEPVNIIFCGYNQWNEKKIK